MTVRVDNLHELPPRDLLDALTFCASACRIDADKIGWMPHQGYRDGWLQRRLIRVTNNDDQVGFALWALARGELKIFQCWVRPDARMILHGRALIDHLDEIAQRRGAYRLRCWVAEDLAANLFWRAIGFSAKTWRWSPRSTSRRRHLLWTRPTPPHADAKLLSPPGPSSRERDQSECEQHPSPTLPTSRTLRLADNSATRTMSPRHPQRD